MQKITAHLWFDREAKEAAEFYVSVFTEGAKRFGAHGESKITHVSTIHNTPSGDCDIVSFELNGQPFMAISAGPMFKFNEAISLLIPCESQEEMDYYSDRLSADPKSEQCGWVKDKYGLSWQVHPTALDKMLVEGTPEQVDRVTQAFLQMKRFDIAKLKQIFEGS